MKAAVHLTLRMLRSIQLTNQKIEFYKLTNQKYFEAFVAPSGPQLKMAALVNKSLGMCLRMLWKVLTKFSFLMRSCYLTIV